MRLSPDEMIFWQHGFLKLNGTIVFTWGVMLLLVIGSMLITRKLSMDLKRERWQNLLEMIVIGTHGTDQRSRSKTTGKIHRIFRYPVSIRRDGEPVHDHPRFRATHRITFDHSRACFVCADRGASFRHRGPRTGWIFKNVHGADLSHAPLQYHQ